MTDDDRPPDPAFVYRYKDGLYLNLTNRCPTSCVFCIKRSWEMRYRSYDLDLGGREPPVEAVLEAVRGARDEAPFREIVFCGYGEPTYRLEGLLRVCDAAVRELPGVTRRLNTVGLGNLICGRDIVPELKGRLDSVSVSLNTADPDQWAEIMRPRGEFLATGHSAVQEFIRACVKILPETVATAVSRPGVDLDACRRLAESLGAKWRVRPWLADYERQ